MNGAELREAFFVTVYKSELFSKPKRLSCHFPADFC